MKKLVKSLTTCGGGHLFDNEKRIVKNVENSGSGGSLYPPNTVIESPDDIIKKRVYADDMPSGSGGSLFPIGLKIQDSKNK